MVNLTSGHLFGDVIPWYQWLIKTIGFPTWNEFCRYYCSRFGSKEDDDPEGALAKLYQTGNVRKYKTMFERLANRCCSLPELFIIRCFISGLKEDIKAGVNFLSPQSLSQAYVMAERQEDTLGMLVSTISKRCNSWKFASPSLPTHSNQILPKQSDLALPSAVPKLVTTGPRRLSIAEQLDRKAKNLCFNCDEQLKPGHRCKRPQLLLLEMEYENSSFVPENEQATEEQPALEVSLNANVGNQRSGTMKLLGYISKHQVTVLVDSGSTHNFLHPRIVKQCGIHVDNSHPMSVTVANGSTVNYPGHCSKVKLVLRGHTFTLDFYILHVCDYEIVFGADWLQSLGVIQWDFRQLTMSFDMDAKPITLNGVPTTFSQVLDEGEFQKIFLQEGRGLYICLLDSCATIEPQMSTYVTSLLEQYSDLFEALTELPPRHDHDHRIPLLPGSAPTNVRPYRYPHFQRSEIEKLIYEMRDTGIIRPSTSPFSSPVDHSKIEATMQWPRPTSLKPLRGFLGLTGYYRKFVREYGYVQTKFHESEIEFNELKTALSTTPTLASPDFTREFVLECDASGLGLGVFLTQDCVFQ
ncbi:uncharacterized protein LOC113312001 [Papaver somniferum]|uniref:uncharacterized protein LOC113312001 n=1 Tax=Papaver somniferum TaxID=3469 RepID=UPI000E6F62E3|nr:uncharacterized protein LOC113312001 [Papaver somniferum]